MEKNNPVSIGLQKEQLEDLERRSKKSGCSKASFIYYAIRRYKRGDFVIPEQDPKEKNIVPITVWKKVDLEDWKVRCILRQHFAIPDQKLALELARSNRECDELLKLYTKEPAIFDDPEEEKKYKNSLI